MRLRNPIITILLITVLVLNLIFFSFVLISKTVVNKEYLKDIIKDFDIKIYILNNENIENSINNYKYPKEVFNYLDEDTFKNKLIDKLYDNDSYDIEKEMLYMINKSVNEYDSINMTDSSTYINSDIKLLAKEFSNFINENIVNLFNLMKDISNSLLYIISIILSIVLCGIIIYIEGRKGIIINSIILFFYSLFCYYINNHFYSIIVSSFGNNKNLLYLKKCNFSLDSVYIICFILSFVLLLIYMIHYIKKWFRNRHLYFGSWR